MGKTNRTPPVYYALKASGKAVRIRNGDKFGRKVAGMLSLPAAWVPQFFVVSPALIEECRSLPENGIANVVGRWLGRIQSQVKLRLNTKDTLILRSSGMRENISARGRYSSHITTFARIEETLTKYIKEHLERPSTSTDKVSIIFQVYKEPKEEGHLSNERRFYEEIRDWLGERTLSVGSEIVKQPFQINLRAWREQRSLTASTAPLICTSDLLITDVLREAVRWATTNKYRLHFEWIWDGEQIWLVQADTDDSNELGEDPKHMRSLVPSEPRRALAKLSKISASRHKKYQKIKNVFSYRKLGLASSSIWVLDDLSIIKQLAKGSVNTQLQEDLAELCRSPLIIRSDLSRISQGKRQMLPRTDEKRNPKEAIKWLIATAKWFQQEQLFYAKPAFLFHHFLPALASAFAYAQPNRREVLIESLWGLPEGLYYNSHDKYIVDTGNSDLKIAIAHGCNTMAVDTQREYKPYFIAPDESGRWIAKRLKQPYDWQASLKDPDAKEIAIQSRKICEEVGSAISVMWFIGLPDNRGLGQNMAWHHEPISLNNSRNPHTGARKKTTFDHDFTIRTETDLIPLAESKTNRASKIMRLRIQPVEDALLRDKELLRRVGELAQEMNVPILLEGGILSHAYYQLAATGAAVEVAHPFNWKATEREFNKLVRDNIPNTIRHFGETVREGRLDSEGKKLALKHKLLEEVLELMDASSIEDLMGELADVEEVLSQIRIENGITQRRLREEMQKKKLTKGGFKRGIILLDTGLPTGQLKDCSKDSTPELLDMSYDEATPIPFTQYLAMTNEVDPRTDQRINETWRESILQASIPMVALDWKGKTIPLITRQNGDEVIGTLKLERDGNGLRVDIRVRICDLETESLKLS